MLTLKRHAYGFTVIELLVVIVVIAILAAISTVAYSGIQERARTAAHQARVNQAEKQITTHALSSGQSSSGVSGNLIAYKEGYGNIDLLDPLTGTPDITMYAVYEVTSTSAAYHYFARLMPFSWNSNVFDLDTGPSGSSAMRYRIDTPAAFNYTSTTMGIRIPGNTIIGWLQVSNSGTLRSHGYNQAAAQGPYSLDPGTGWNFTGVRLDSGTDHGTGVAALVFKAAHDQTTRAQVIDWLADEYGVSL